MAVRDLILVFHCEKSIRWKNLKKRRIEKKHRKKQPIELKHDRPLRKATRGHEDGAEGWGLFTRVRSSGFASCFISLSDVLLRMKGSNALLSVFSVQSDWVNEHLPFKKLLVF